jgi:hypothetical protein
VAALEFVDDEAIVALPGRLSTPEADDLQLMSKIRITRRHLTGWRPPLTPFTRPQLVPHPPLNTPNMILSPSVISRGRPALQLRAITTYKAGPTWAACFERDRRDTPLHAATDQSPSSPARHSARINKHRTDNLPAAGSPQMTSGG